MGSPSLPKLTQEFTLDLKKINPNTAEGQRAIENWKTEIALAYCGPIDMPQPLDLIEYRPHVIRILNLKENQIPLKR